MSVMVRHSEKAWTPAPEGLHAAVCTDALDLGEQETPWGRKPKVELRWQIDETNPDTGKRFDVRARFTASLHEKARLRQTLETWRAKKFSADDLKGFDLEKLIGVNCQIQIVHVAGDEGKVWANVQAIVPPAKGSVKLTVVDYTREQDRATNGDAPAAAEDENVPF